MSTEKGGRLSALDGEVGAEDGVVLFITSDEGSTAVHGGGHIPTIVASPLVRAGTKDAAAANHYSILRTIEGAGRLGCLKSACAADNLASLFR